MREQLHLEMCQLSKNPDYKSFDIFIVKVFLDVASTIAKDKSDLHLDKCPETFVLYAIFLK